jgi:hypothetical protein
MFLPYWKVDRGRFCSVSVRCTIPFGSRQKCGRPGESADLYITPAREAELIVIFKEATRLEVDF